LRNFLAVEATAAMLAVKKPQSAAAAKIVCVMEAIIRVIVIIIVRIQVLIMTAMAL
jgi:hypothetical protein